MEDTYPLGSEYDDEESGEWADEAYEDDDSYAWSDQKHHEFLCSHFKLEGEDVGY